MIRSRYSEFRARFNEVVWLSLLAGIVLAACWASVDRIVGRTQGSFPAFVERVTHISMVDRTRGGLVLNSRNNRYNTIVFSGQTSIRNTHVPVGQETHQPFLVHFVELPVHKILLSTSLDCGNECTQSDNTRESEFPLVRLFDSPFSLKKLLKLLYFFTCLYVSMYFWRKSFSASRQKVVCFTMAFILMIGHGTLVLLFV